MWLRLRTPSSKGDLSYRFVAMKTAILLAAVALLCVVSSANAKRLFYNNDDDMELSDKKARMFLRSMTNDNEDDECPGFVRYSRIGKRTVLRANLASTRVARPISVSRNASVQMNAWKSSQANRAWRQGSFCFCSQFNRANTSD